ncbi:Glycosyltransferase involved in cell wall bisynthesis [Cruoricaptor ignavus]|uniref:Glycosyltransferase involved in cell wall bisynthesis n=1 Tax=Cruoricaptor ignavus TaxID=1118202 RepID=A0A1M6CYN0_9FLAO|nr:glycosyltransferase [Cruoricaptor ignavus]SHI65983.1 Glycosyltransferase involved in cell wall bisynthesis [Cruoricaptor ignavus]
MTAEKKFSTPIAFFIIDYTASGGVEKVTADLMQGFADKGFVNLHLLSLQPSKEIPTMNFPVKFRAENNLGNKNNFAKNLFDYLKNHNIEFLIFQGDNVSISLKILQVCNAIMVQAYPQYHGSPFAYLKKYSDAERKNWDKKIVAGLQFPFKKAKLKRYISNSKNGIFCVSEGSAKELKKIFPSLADKVKVRRNPINFNFPGLEKKQKIVSFLSRMENRHKNAFLSVKAWQKIHHNFPDWSLHLAGEGALLKKMKQFAAEQNIENIVFHGFLQNPENLLAKSAISISCSNCEGYSMSIAEAIVHRNAIAATKSDGGIQDMLIDGQTALLSPKNDAEGLAENIARLIQDANLRRQVAEAALENLKQQMPTDVSALWINEFFG